MNFCLKIPPEFGTIGTQSQKTTAEPRNSNKLSTAQSTPKACFFMRKLHTPKERPERLSMVACNGKGSALCCVPLIAVFEPVTRYRQSLETKAVTLEKFINGVTQMYQFIFAVFRHTHEGTNRALKIRITADNEQQARNRFVNGDRLHFVGRINLHRQNTPKTNRTLQGACYA
nr:host cell division inhibitor Icd-like protein [uncultured Haemophilus sp.]